MSQNAAFKVLQNTVALSVARVSVPAFSFIFVIFAARLLGVDDFGKFVLAQTFFLLFLSLSVAGVNTIITREMARKPLWLNRYLSASTVLVTLLVAISNVILFLIAMLSNYDTDTRMAIYLVGIALFPAAMNLVSESAFVAFEKAFYVTYGTIFENILRVALSIIALYQGYGIVALFAILAITRTMSLLFYILFLNLHITRVAWLFEGSFFKQLVREWIVFALENWIFNIYYRINIVFLSIFGGTRLVGIYGAAEKILQPASVLSTSFTGAIFPYFSRVFEESRQQFQKISETSLKYLFAIALLGVILTITLADRIILWLFTAEYAGAIQILQVLILAQIPDLLKNLLSHILFARNEQKRALHIAIATLILKLLLCIVLIPKWGGMGAAWALFLSELTSSGLYFYFVLPKARVIPMFWTFVRMVPAGVGISIFILVFQEVHLVPLLSGAIVGYGLLILSFGVVTTSDMHFVQELAQHGRQWVAGTRRQA